MKKIFLTLFVSIFLVNLASSQEVKNALGLRFGAGYGMGTEITFQHALNSVNRLELDLEFNGNHEYIENTQNNYNSLSAIGFYHWVWPIQDGFKWYAGPGGKLGTWNSMIYNSRYNNGIFLSIAGDVGIEYSFPAKIQLALNARPEIGLFNYGSGLNIGLAVRYQF